MRQLLGLSVALGTSAFAAVVLGEYELTGVTATIAGVLLGLVVGEILLSVARRPLAAVTAVAALGVGGAVVWAAWISAGRDWDFFPAAAWIGAPLATATLAGWVLERERAARRVAAEDGG